VDGLLEEVAEILAVTLRPATPKVRITVRSLGDIALLSRRTGRLAGHRTECGRHWERIAQEVEDALPLSAPMVRRPSVPDVAGRAVVVPVFAPAN
jgi:hypothetical protein